MSKEPEQWAVKQHLEKFPKCEMLCMHTSLPNLGEVKQSNNKGDSMKTYAPALTPSFVIESDGDSWFCHDSTFINVAEDDNVAFGDSPLLALSNFLALQAVKENKS